jgi:uncharacterized protein with FMN-binding domain
MSCATTGGLVYLFAGASASQAQSDALAAIDALPAPIATSAPTPTVTTPATAPTPSAPTPSAPTPTTAAGDTTATTALVAFDGDVIDTKFGPVQVQVQISAGAVVDVAVEQYPDGDHKSVSINADALPTLRSEVLSAQSAEVDTVSGATYTSNAYRHSLQSAIDEARASGAVQ